MHDNGPIIWSIARMIREHRLSRAEIALALDLNPEQMDTRLAMMVRQGFLSIESHCNQVGRVRIFTPARKQITRTTAENPNNENFW